MSDGIEHDNHGSYFKDECPHCASGKEIERLTVEVFKLSDALDDKHDRIAELESNLRAAHREIESLGGYDRSAALQEDE